MIAVIENAAVEARTGNNIDLGTLGSQLQQFWGAFLADALGVDYGPAVGVIKQAQFGRGFIQIVKQKTWIDFLATAGKDEEVFVTVCKPHLLCRDVAQDRADEIFFTWSAGRHGSIPS
ncbi:MAG: hypothetical protein ABSA77_02125 [Thermoguttaceae bacterium]